MNRNIMRYDICLSQLTINTEYRNCPLRTEFQVGKKRFSFRKTTAEKGEMSRENKNNNNLIRKYWNSGNCFTHPNTFPNYHLLSLVWILLLAENVEPSIDMGVMAPSHEAAARPSIADVSVGESREWNVKQKLENRTALTQEIISLALSLSFSQVLENAIRPNGDLRPIQTNWANSAQIGENPSNF